MSSSNGSPTPDPGPGSETRKRKRHCFTRSKAGCQMCRKQKKKCDEARPTCGRCTAFGRVCLYPVSSPVWVESDQRGHPIVSRTVQPIATPVASSSRGLGAVTDCTVENRTIDNPASRYSTQGTSFAEQVNRHLFTPGSSTTLPLSTVSFARGSNPTIGTTTEENLEWLYEGVHPAFDMNLGGVGNDAIGVAPSMNTDLPSATGLEDIGITDAFWETFLGPLTQPVIPLPEHSPTVSSSASAATSARPRPSGALLSVPLLCDSSLWSSFVDSSLWDTRSVPGDDGAALLEHFSTFASTTIVVRNDQTSASAFYAQLADKATKDKQDALMHAVLCTSAVHLANWAMKVNDQIKGVHFADLAAQHRAQALHCLRVSSAKNDKLDEEMNAATMILLTLSGLLRGDTDVMPSFISRTATMLAKVKHPRQDTMLPSISALHSIYTGLHSIATGKQIDVDSLFPRMDERNIWDPRSEEVVESVLGVRKEMFLQLVRVHTLIVEHDTITSALEREGGADEELSMMQIELHSECSTIEVSFNNDVHWQAKYMIGCVERTQIGHECFRLAIQLMIIRHVFKYPTNHPRVKALSSRTIDWLEKCRPTTEIGLLFPLIIGGSDAPEALHERYRAFCQRCTWKGSSGPRLSAEIVEDVWAARKEGKEDTWRDVIQAKGSPLLV